MESSGQAVFKTVPGFTIGATFEVDIEGFTPLKVLLATTVYGDQINKTGLRFLPELSLSGPAKVVYLWLLVITFSMPNITFLG